MVAYRLLGRLIVTVDGEQIGLGGEQQRALLAMLLLADSRPVSTRRLLAGLWVTPPRRAENAIQVYVSRLRGLLRRGGRGPADAIRLTAAGYELTRGPGQLDLDEVRCHADAGRASARAGRFEDASTEFRLALSLWGGPPLEEFSRAPFAPAGQLRLGELRIATILECIDADLALGRHGEIIGELYDAVEEFPFHEALWQRLMLSLDRSGRQADALRAFHDVRRLLGRELGVEPGPPIQAIQRAILAGHDGHEPRPAPTAIDTGRSTIVGRRAERSLLGEVFERVAARGTPALVSVLGDPGIGKTALVEDFARSLAASRRVQVFRASCRPYEWRDGLGPLLRAVGASTVDAEQRGPASLHQTRVVVRQMLQEAALHTPVLLLLDDIHWAAPELLDTIEDIACRGGGSIMLTCCARRELLEHRPGWAALVPASSTLLLPPLSHREVAELATAVLGDPAQVDKSLVRTLAEQTGGNALLVSECLASRARATSTPELPDDVRRVGAAASVVGMSFDRATVTHLVSSAAGVDPATALERLVAAGLVYRTQRGQRGEVFVFRHELVRDRLGATLIPSERARLHELMVGWIVANESDLASSIGRLAHHLDQAQGGGGETALAAGGRSPSIAVERVAGAGREALGRGEMQGAASLLQCAARSLPRGHPTRLRALGDLAAALADAGEPHRAETVLSDAMNEATAALDDLATHRIRIERTWVRLDLDPTAVALPQLRLEARRAIARFEQCQDRASLVRVWLLLANVHNLAGQYSEQVRAAERALELCGSTGHTRELALAAGFVASGLRDGSAPVEEVLSRVGSLAELAPGEPLLRVVTIGTIGMAYAWQGIHDRALAMISECREISADLGWPWHAAIGAWRSGQIEQLGGNLAAAQRDYRYAYQTYSRLGDHAHLATLAPYLAEVVARQGELSEAKRILQVSRAMASRADVAAQIQWRRVAATVHLLEDELDRADELSCAALALASRTELLTIRGDVIATRCQVVGRMGQVDEAVRLAGRAARIYRRKGSPVLVSRAQALAREAMIGHP